MQDNNKPTTQQRDLAKLPRALAPLIERPQWCVWRWTQKPDGKWQKPPYQAREPQRHASTKDSATWSDYAAALAAVQAGQADGITYMLTAADPFAAIDLDHCRHPETGSIDIWAQNFLEVGRTTYAEATPSGEGCRIWGLTAEDSAAVNRKFTLEIDGKPIAAELFRRAPKALTITGYTLDRAIHELTNVDKAFAWAIVWGERRKAAAEAAAAEAAQANGHSFNGNGPSYQLEHIERLVREGANGGNRSDSFHAVVGHYLGCDWSVDRITEHLAQFPNGIADKYIGEERLRGEVERSAAKYAERLLPVMEGWTAPEPTPAPIPAPTPTPPAPESPQPWSDPELEDDVDESALKRPPPMPDPELEQDPELDDSELEEDDPELEDEPPPAEDPKLPRMYSHGDPDPRPLKAWAIKGLMPTVGHGLLSGQWGTYKTFVVFDLVAALATGQAFLSHLVKRQCGTMLIAAEGSDEVRLRADAVVREKCGGMQRAPLRWYEETPLLLQKDAVKTLIAMARQADASLQKEFGLPLGLVVVDTVSSCAGYTKSGDGNDGAAGQAVMNVLKAVARALGCFVLGVAHFGKNVEAGTSGTVVKEDASDLVLACLGEKQLNGSVTNTRLAIRKNKGGKQGQEFPFTVRLVETPELDEDGEPYTTMVVDWLPAGAAAQQAAPPADDPWLKGCRRDDQRAIMVRLKRVLLAALAEHGIEQPIPSKVRVQSSPPIGDELWTATLDAPIVRMVDQDIVRGAFDLHTPQDPRQTRYERFKAARDRAEQLGLIGAGNSDSITYLWLTRPEPENDEGVA